MTTRRTCRFCVLRFATLLSCCLLASSARKQPNILFLMCDSMDGRVLDPSSPVWERVDMPNLRNLARSGTNFVRTYAASPQCVPSRTSMFAGRHTHHIKAWSNSQGFARDPSTGKLDADCVKYYDEKQCNEFAGAQNLNATFMDTLEAARCDVCLIGKVDVGAGVIESPGQGNSTADGWHNGASAQISGRTADIRKPTKPDPLNITNDNDNNVHPEDWRTVAKCIDWLETHHPDAENGGSDSWLLYCSLNIPHPSFQTNATWLSYVNNDTVNVPTWLSREDFHPADAYMSQSKDVWRDFSDAEIKEVRMTYYAMCAETDYLLGRVLDAAKRTGHLNGNTYVVFLSDHGEMNMEHRQVWKNSLYEASTRVPLVISGPGVSAGAINYNLTSLLDIHPTLLDMVGAKEKPSWLDGYSLAPLLVGDGTSTVEDVPLVVAAKRGDGENQRPAYVVSQYHSNMGNTGSFMLRQGRFKFIAFGTTLSAFRAYMPQLFDLDADPEELNDLLRSRANDPDIRKLADGFDKTLRSVVDYPEVDREAKINDGRVYKRWLFDRNGGNSEGLRRAWEDAYSGFDDEDWERVQEWQEEIFALVEGGV